MGPTTRSVQADANQPRRVRSPHIPVHRRVTPRRAHRRGHGRGGAQQVKGFAQQGGLKREGRRNTQKSGAQRTPSTDGTRHTSPKRGRPGRQRTGGDDAPQSTGWPHPDGTRPTINREDREQGHTESVGKENRQQETGQVQTKAEDQPKDTRDKHKASTAKAKGRGDEKCYNRTSNQRQAAGEDQEQCSVRHREGRESIFTKRRTREPPTMARHNHMRRRRTNLNGN